MSRATEDERKVSYNILGARHSGDGVILLAGLRSYDANLSVTFIADMQRIVVKFVPYCSTSTVRFVHLPFSFGNANWFEKSES